MGEKLTLLVEFSGGDVRKYAEVFCNNEKLMSFFRRTER